MRRLAVPLLLAALALSGCGDGPSPADDLRDRVADLRQDAETLRDRARNEARKVGRDIERRVREALEDLERSVPRAGPATRPPSTRTSRDIEAFLVATLRSVDSYWTRTFEANNQPEPRVSYLFVPPGRLARSGCGAPADDMAAFYCPSDDTIYIGQSIAAGVIDGVVEGFPGEGRAVGDFGAAYLVAHEYAHNLQEELGFFSSRRRGAQARPFELQADCLAGVWGASVYRAGRLKPGDVEEALSTALAVGDFEVGSEQHHGTPEERRDAWQLGFTSGEPRDCTAFITA